MKEAEEICLSHKPKKLFLENNKKIIDVDCLTCRQKVCVKLVIYGFGYAAICPCCGHLAYSAN